jgi:hypothetical protein
MSPAIPWFISLIVIATNSAIAVAVWTILARSRARGGRPRESGRRTVNGLALFLGVWLAAGIFIAPKLGLPVSPGGVAIPPVILLAGIGVAVVLAWLSVSSDLRRTVAAAPLPAVIGVQVYRAIGAVFVFLLGLGQLPPHFALPAGWGDVVVGITAPVVALALLRGAPGSRLLALSWNLFGLLDLVVAVGMGSGLLVPLLAPGQPPAPAAAMQQFPLVVIPAFAVPVSILLHILALSGLRRRMQLRSGIIAPAR